MINELSFRKLRNPEFLQFFTQALVFIKANPAVASATGAQTATLQTLVERIDQLFKTDTQSPLSENLAALDAERDRYVVGISKICDGYTLSPNDAEREMARALVHNISVYGTAGDIGTENYNAETATIRSLVKDWTENQTLANAINSLHLGDWKSALEQVNNTFDNTYTKRTGDMAAADTPDTVKAKRMETIQAWYALRRQIDANQVLATEKAPWDNVISQLNTSILQYDNLLKGRAGRNDAGKGTDGGGGAVS